MFFTNWKKIKFTLKVFNGTDTKYSWKNALKKKTTPVAIVRE